MGEDQRQEKRLRDTSMHNGGVVARLDQFLENGTSGKTAESLFAVARLTHEKIVSPSPALFLKQITSERPVLVVLAAGKGRRFGKEPKCAQIVAGKPLARHSVDAFRSLGWGPAIAIVGYQEPTVRTALGEDLLYIRTDNPVGGTAFAAYEAFCVGRLLEENPVVVICMGDRVLTGRVLQALHATHHAGTQEADLTFLTAYYTPPRHKSKGRIVRDQAGRVLCILEQSDIDSLSDEELRQELDSITEGNCPLYLMRARTLYRYLSELTRDNAQGQYYLTDLVKAVRRDGGEVRTLTLTDAAPDYHLLVLDVTRPEDLGAVEHALYTLRESEQTTNLMRAAEAILAGRPLCQVEAIASQLEEMLHEMETHGLGFQPDLPVALGIAGGRLRVAIMHPDMRRFFGPAWQMPIGASCASGREQILVLAQTCNDDCIHLWPTNPQFREGRNWIPASSECMYPPEDVKDYYTYEGFGTRMAEEILRSLGYVSERELAHWQAQSKPLPPMERRISANMRRPFSLVANAIASLRTWRNGEAGERIAAALSNGRFRGVRLLSSGAIPQGGFASSSAVTLAVQNALNALYDLKLKPQDLIHLAGQAEYGTGVRAGSLDHAALQISKAGQAALISSNPKDGFRILGIYPVPTQRFRVFFAQTVDRDREAWRWSAGFYADRSGLERLTAGEIRKMTGKAAEIAAVLLRLPLNQDFFKEIEADLLEDGLLDLSNRKKVYQWLRHLPLLISREELRQRLEASHAWYAEQWRIYQKATREAACEKAREICDSLLSDWNEPVFRRSTPEGRVVTERGVPLRAMVAYLFGEVAKNLYLIHNPESWIEYVSRSQWGDRCFEIDPKRLPTREEMLRPLPWEADLEGPRLMEAWLGRYGAVPTDYNRGLDDASLDDVLAQIGRALQGQEPDPCQTHLHLLEGGNFFRGLALVDLIGAMLKRAFGEDAVAVRVNAAGQGDFFQVHVDVTRASVAEVQEFIRRAVYQRFGLHPNPAFVETHPGGSATGIRLERYDQLPSLITLLRQLVRERA